MISERWRLATEILRENRQNESQFIAPPDEISGDEVCVRRAIIGKTSGIWLIWCELGPLLCVRYDQDRWSISIDREYRDRPEVAEEYKELKEWYRSEEPLWGPFRTRREAITTLRAALSLR